MKVVVFGYHDVGCACLRALIEGGAEVVLVVTHEDDPDENIWFGSVEAIARAAGIAVIKPADANAAGVVDRIQALGPDVFVSCYFRQILGSGLLAIPALGAFNMHGSLLPKFRGRAPVNWVLVKGETETGVTLHIMAEKPDRGDIVGQRRVPIDDEDTALTLHRKCAAAAGGLMRELWPLIEAGTAPRIPQDPSMASYFGRRRPEDGRLDWSRPARECRNLVRAVTHPYPGAFTTASGNKLFVWKAAASAAPTAPAEPGTVVAVEKGRGFRVATGDGTLLAERVQIEGAEEMQGDEALDRGLVAVGQRLG